MGATEDLGSRDPDRLDAAVRLWLYERQAVLGVLRRIAGNGDLDDLLSEVKVRWLHASTAGAIDPGGNPAGYLMRIARSVAVDHVRRRRAGQLPGIEAADPTAEAVVEATERNAVRRALLRLSRRQQYALELAGDGRTLDDISAALHVNHNAASQLLWRSRIRARLAYLDEVFGPGAPECTVFRAAMASPSPLRRDVERHLEACAQCLECRNELAGLGWGWGAWAGLFVRKGLPRRHAKAGGVTRPGVVAAAAGTLVATAAVTGLLTVDDASDSSQSGARREAVASDDERPSRPGPQAPAPPQAPRSDDTESPPDKDGPLPGPGTPRGATPGEVAEGSSGPDRSTGSGGASRGDTGVVAVDVELVGSQLVLPVLEIEGAATLVSITAAADAGEVGLAIDVLPDEE